MKITIEDTVGGVEYGGSATGIGVEYHEVVELFKQASMAAGFHPDTVLGYFNELEEEKNGDDDRN